MSILIASLALAAAQTPPAAPANPHAQHQHGQHQHQAQHAQHGQKGCCCCKEKMASGQAMECCAKHGESHGDGSHPSGHGAHSGDNHN